MIASVMADVQYTAISMLFKETHVITRPLFQEMFLWVV